MLKNVRDKVEKGWTWTKKCLAALSCWGLVFSLVTIGRLAVAFDYDDTLVFSAPAFSKAFANSVQAYTPGFWSVVNRSYDLEKPKMLAYGLAWAFRIMGFRVTILTSRPPVEAEALKKEWRHLAPQGRFVFAGDGEGKTQHLQDGNYVLYFADNDSDIASARRAKVYAVRIRRSRRSFQREDYHPGTFGEFVLPLSEY